MTALLIAVLLVAAFTAILLAAMDVGRRLRVAQPDLIPDSSGGAFSSVEGAVFGLLGLLVAFTFAGAAQRFEGRRQLVVQEANAIGTAYLRLDVLPPAAQPQLRELVREYVDARLAVYAASADLARARAELDRVAVLQQKIWTQAVAATQAAPTPAPQIVVLPALNEMFDVANARYLATRMHVPLLLMILLAALSLASALLAGYLLAGNPKKTYFHTLTFALGLAVALYVIVDYEFPRIGLIRMNALDQAIVDVRATMQ